MSSGKKGKKSKQTTYNLTDFLASNIGGPTIPIKSSWADDEEDDHEYSYTPQHNKDPVVLPTAPRAARDPDYDEENIPINGPFIAYVSNIPYEIEDDDLYQFFGDLRITNLQIPKTADKPKGFGYVEFADRQTLIDALALSNQTIKSRRIKIEVSRNSNDDRRNRGGRDNRREYDDPERTSGDWRSGPRDEPSSEGDRYRSRGGFERDSRDGGSDSGPGAWRVGGGGGFDKDREGESDRPAAWRGSSYESRDRGSGGGGGGGGWRDDRGRSYRDRGNDDRDRDYQRFGDRERAGSRDRDGDRGSYGNRRYGDSDRDRDGRSYASESSEPRTRPKLQLQPRTKPIEQIVTAPTEPTIASKVEAPRPTVPAANIFGAAKPVDTAAREREIEERLARNAEVRSKDDGEPAIEKRGTKEGIWGRRNGEGRDDKEREKSRPLSKPGDEKIEKYVAPRGNIRNQPRDGPGESQGYGESRGPAVPPSGYRAPPKSEGPVSRPAPEKTERERKDKHKDSDEESSRRPKVKDDQAPNFCASNKYSMLRDEDEDNNIDD